MSVVDMNTGEIVGPGTDLASLDPSDIDRAADPGAFVVLCLERSKTWLTEALSQGDIGSIMETKALAETIRVATIQKQLGKDSELAATEIVRRAERCIGLAIRQGQAAGTIRKQGDPSGPSAGEYVRVRNGRKETVTVSQPVVRDPNCISPAGYFSSGQDQHSTYLVADVSEQQFETALDEAKAEGNLSRANVVRKVKGETPAATGGRPEHLRKFRHHDANRIVNEIAIGLEGYVLAQALIDFDQLDRTQVAAWSDSLSESLRSLNRLNRQLKELDQA